MPAVISVFLFICYFIIDNTGSNLAKEQVFPPFAGMWLSSFILLPLGVFFTYKAVNDSVIMNADTYLQLFKALRGRVKRTFERPEIIMDPTSKTELYDLAFGLYQLADKYNETPNNGFINDYKNYWLSADKEVEEINRILEERLVPMLRNYEDKLISVKQVELPVLMMDRYSNPVSEQVIWMRNSLYFVFPIGVIPFLFSRFAKRSIIKDVNKIKMVSLDIIKQIKDT